MKSLPIILYPCNSYSSTAFEKIAAKLPKNSTIHHSEKPNNEAAADWVAHHMTRGEEDPINKKYQFLIIC